MKLQFLAPALMAGMMLFSTSCKKDDDNKIEAPMENAREATIDASGNEWKYFSFSSGKEVSVVSPTTSLDWDIAFNRYYVKLNGGASGDGKAEALKTDKTQWNEVNEAPVTGYSKDEKGTMQLGMPPKPIEGTFCKIISGGMKDENKTGYVTYNPKVMQSGGGNPYEIYKYVYVLKAANGDFVKIQFTDYLNDKNKGGHPKFNYIVSKDSKF